MLKHRKWIYVLEIIAAFVAAFLFKVNVIYIIFAAVGVGLFLELWNRRKRGSV